MAGPASKTKNKQNNRNSKELCEVDDEVCTDRAKGRAVLEEMELSSGQALTG